MINIYICTTINKPIQQVFDFVSKPENDFQWQYGTLKTARLSEGVNNSRTFFRSLGHLMGRRNLSTFEVTEYLPNNKYSINSLSGPLHSRTSYTFETAKGGTKINVSIQANVVNFYHLEESLVEKSLKKQLKENLALLKNLLESNQIPPVSETSSLTNNNMI
jgi:uncharacterized protein YndB with AHSA1/START domain